MVKFSNRKIDIQYYESTCPFMMVETVYKRKQKNKKIERENFFK